MEHWQEIEDIARSIIIPFLDSQGRISKGRLAGTEHLLGLLPLLQNSEVLKIARKNISSLTILLYPPDNYNGLVAIVPPGPMLNGSKEEFTIALQRKEQQDYEVVKEVNIHYQDMGKILQVVEDYFQTLL